jgi:sugar transferase (PEP-CTERM/EpsH1 system associated)
LTPVPDALFLTHRIPYPPNKGEKIRAYHLLRHLAQRWRVHLGCFVDRPEDLAHVATLCELCAQVKAVLIRPGLRRVAALRGLAGRDPLTFAYHASPTLSAWVADVRAQSDPTLEYAFSSGMAPYLFRGRADRDAGKRVVDLVDLDSEKWRAYAAQPGWRSRLYRLEARRLADREVALTCQADLTVLVSEAEATDLRRRPNTCGARVHVVSNGVDLAFFNPVLHQPHPQPEDATLPALCFTGVMDYRPNVDGVLWFAEQVWPQLAAARPDLCWWIVGARPDPRVLALGKLLPRVTVAGDVPDVRPWLAQADLAVVPLLMARGVQNKLLEAMAMELPVVATSVSAHGLDPATRALLTVADEPLAFANAVLGLLADAEARHIAGRAGRRRMEEAFGWAARLAELDRLLAEPRPSASPAMGRPWPAGASPIIRAD